MRHILPQPKWNSTLKRWELRIQVDKRRKQFTSTRPRTEGKNECREKAAKWLESLDSNGNVTFEVAFQRFLDDYKLRYGESEQYRQNWQLGTSHLIPKLGRIRCGDIRIEDYQSCINEAKPVLRHTKKGKPYYLTDRLSKKTLKNIKGVISLFHKWARARKYTDLDITDALYVPIDAPVGHKDILQLDEIEKIFSEPTGHHYERAIMFEILTGVRPGELLGLKIEDYDPVTGIMHIRRSISYQNKITPGKNKNARRDIMLPDIVRQIVEEQIKVSRSLHSEWIFCQPSGQHGIQTALLAACEAVCEAHGIKTRITPYSLRHTFYTHTEAYIPDRMIKMVFGHSERTDGHHIYGEHSIDGELKEVSEKLAITPIYQVANN